jgi:tetraacyldisaccharide-1-P 4'-kinase
VWITHADLVRDRDLQAICELVEGLAPAARVWQAVHRPVRLWGLSGGGEVEPEALRGRRVQALSSLGNPGAFERTLGKLGAVVVSRVRFPDHYRYCADDLERLASEGRDSPDCIVTTEKDAVRLLQADVRQPIWVLEVELAGHGDGPTLSEEFGCLLGAVVKT